MFVFLRRLSRTRLQLMPNPITSYWTYERIKPYIASMWKCKSPVNR